MAGFDSPSLVVGWTSSLIASEGEPPPPQLALDALPTLPAARSRANCSPFLPSQVAQSAPPSPAAAATRRSEVVGSLLPPLPPPPTSLRAEEAPRSRCACPVCVHVCRTCTCTLPLTGPSKLTLTTATLRPALRPYRPRPVCTRLRHSRRRTGCACAAAAHRERCCPAAGHTLTAHS